VSLVITISLVIIVKIKILLIAKTFIELTY